MYGGALIGKKEKDAIKKAVDKNYWPAGEEAAKMEKEVAKYLGMKHALLANSGSSAGLLALTAYEFPKGSEVIIPAVTFPTIFNIILQNNLIPVVVDSKIGTYNLDPDELEAAITEKTKAIICVHAVGNVIDLKKVRQICNKHKIKLILDNCDGFGSSLHGKKVETYADVAFTSFHAAHIVAMGQGGGIFTNDTELARKVRMYRDWGRQSDIPRRTNNGKWPELPDDYDMRFIYEKVGYNLGPLELQAAMGRVQLKRTERIKKLRKRNFDYLIKHLSKHKDLIMPTWVKGAEVCWFSFPLTTTGERGPLVTHLEKHGIETRSMFGGNITRHPAYEKSEYRIAGQLASANYIIDHSLWISCHPRLTREDREYMVQVFNDYYAAIT